MAAPTIPGQLIDVDWTQRAQILNKVGTLINDFLTYWSSVTPEVSVPDPGSGAVFLTPASTIAAYVSALNAANTEFSLGVTAIGVPASNMDVNAFTASINSILTYIGALHTAKP
jgi:hypothetical protein